MYVSVLNVYTTVWQAHCTVAQVLACVGARLRMRSSSTQHTLAFAVAPAWYLPEHHKGAS